MQFSSDDISYLETTLNLSTSFLDELSNTDKLSVKLNYFESKRVTSGDVLCELTGPEWLLILLESPIHNILGFSSLVATYAAEFLINQDDSN